MRKPADWMQIPIDERVLEALESSNMILSPAVIAINIDKSRHEVNRRLSVLVDSGMVSKVKRGYYEITDLGEQYLAGEIDAGELEPSDE